jgi:hypothetical protein
MRMRRMALCGAALAVLMIGAVLLYSWDPEREFLCYLPHDYRLVRVSDGAWYITVPLYELAFPGTAVKNLGVVLAPSITELNIVGSVVFGQVVDSHVAAGHEAKAQFFILDTVSGGLHVDRSEAEWRSRLQLRYGIATPALLSVWRFCRQEREQTRKRMVEAARVYRERAREAFGGKAGDYETLPDLRYIEGR